MSLYDLIIRNGTLVTAEGISQSDLAIAGGQIVMIEPELEGTSDEEIDAWGMHIFPGGIDAHLHFNDPGRAHWEGFVTGTRALAAGGTTAFFDMPLNASPPTIDAASFDLKRREAQANSLVDFGLWGGLVPGNIDRLEELVGRGVVGFKAFMSNSGIEDFPSVDDVTLYEGMQRVAKLGSIVAVHAENDQITSILARRAREQGKTGIRDYLDSRPVVAELEAIERAILFAQETGCKLHIVHVSSGRGVALVVEARARGIDVSCETCPHYLVLTEDDVERLGAVAKCAPPLRTREVQEELWQQLLAGNIPMVTSDHSPAPAEMKTGSDFFQVWGGISGCQSLLQLLLTDGYCERQLPLETIASLTSAYIARRFHLGSRKGRLAIGADADLALIDLQAESELRTSDLYYRHAHSPYVGKTLHGRIHRTLLRGDTIFLDGQFAPDVRGNLIKPQLS
ncbi:MAG: allantoinase [Ktedonobacteraceae bacterium]|nr:allantoinase [Ktedonobacteraceae bacterium]